MGEVPFRDFNGGEAETVFSWKTGAAQHEIADCSGCNVVRRSKARSFVLLLVVPTVATSIGEAIAVVRVACLTQNPVREQITEQSIFSHV